MEIQSIPAGSVTFPPELLQDAPEKSATDIYIVQLKGDPIISYEGSLAAYQATKPGKGTKLNRNDAHVKRYEQYLTNMQDEVMASVGGRKVYNYCFSFNGFAARMSAADADALSRQGNVVNVWKDEIRQIQTNTSPAYIGVQGHGGAWSKGLTGEDIVIGIVDTGIWPEHPSFADVKTPKKGNKGHKIPYGDIPDGFTPSGCDFGNAAVPGDEPFECTNKLVTARCFNHGFSSAPDPANPCGGDGIFADPLEFRSARDNNGHGSHVASTAGGNNGVPAFIAGEFQGEISGIAPRARIAAYKVCWAGGCASSDSAAAIDQAVSDGVDVINFSIGGSSTSFSSPDDIAFLFAADAGVFVATSNGNAGPGAQTTGTPAGVPWLTAVGATQDDGVFNLVVGVNAPGSVAGAYVALESVGGVSLESTGIITDDVTVTSPANGCAPLTGSISGIALSIRGACSFSDKFNNATAAGASGIIVYNDGTSASRVDPIRMFAPGTTIPGVMVSFVDGDILASAAGVNATMDANATIVADNRIAGFSSRGPNGGAPDVIKPDLSAPGVRILAAETGSDGELFQFLNGTSMASPHVAGSFALLKQAHPDWSPAQARSAMMTTARQNLKKTFGDAAADPFDIGAGEILPSDARDPGLTYDAGFLDYLAFTCDNNVQLISDGFCAALEGAGFPTDGSDLNLASIGIAALVGKQTVTRTVTSVAKGHGKRKFRAHVDAPPGVDVSVSPSTLKLKTGQSASFEVTFTTNSDAVLEEWTFGALTWTDGDGDSDGGGDSDSDSDSDDGYSVRSPIAVRPFQLDTVAEVDSVDDGAGNGSVTVPVKFGYDGVYNASVSGLGRGFSASANITAGDGLHIWCANLPANTHFRAALFDKDTSDPGFDDLDLRVFLAATDCATFDLVALLGSSGGFTSEESVDFSNGPAGGYVVVVDYFAASNGTDTDYTVWFEPVLGDEGNTVVTAPSSATLGASDVVTVDFGGLAPGTRYLGIVHHEDGTGELARTIVDVETQ